MSKAGIATDPEKTAAVCDWPRPETVSQVRSILGFVGYYRHFVPSFSKVSGPLHSLTSGMAPLGKKSRPVDWTPECQQAFGPEMGSD